METPPHIFGSKEPNIFLAMSLGCSHYGDGGDIVVVVVAVVVFLLCYTTG